MVDTFVVLSYSARAYVEALVKAGYHAIALDAFADIDTQQAALTSIKLAFHREGFCAHEVQQRLQELLASSSAYAADIRGLLYGSGVEAQPALLQSISKMLPVLGNAASVLASINSYDFFQQLNTLHIRYPETSRHFLQCHDHERVLIKQLAASGGMHIRYADTEQALQAQEYYQREIPGVCYGILFVANAKDCRKIGIHLQLTASIPHHPMAAGSMLGPVELPAKIEAQILTMAQTLTKHYQLRGLNSLDVIVQGEQVYCLELNARLSASIDLYQTQPALMQMHIMGVEGVLPEQIFHTPAQQINADSAISISARKIIYAQQDIPWAHLSKLSESAQALPDWIADIPNTGPIAQYQPICSIKATADTAERALMLLQQREQGLSECLFKLQSKQNE